MIIKTFRKKGCGFIGQDADSWSDNWGDIGEIVESFRNADKTHLSFFFKKYFPHPPKKILEGGCGTGKYVHAYRKMGYDVVGVDFASKTVNLINKNFPELPIFEGDVLRLPFNDGEFDCYYSGGVIEHFENGPDHAIKEARRILKKQGILLATVPYINLLRKSRFLLNPRSQKRDLMQLKVSSCGQAVSGPKEYSFCEYMFDAKGIKHFFEENGFTVIKMYPIDFLWGELGSVIRWALNKKNGSKNKTNINCDNREPSVKTCEDRRSSMKNIFYEIFVTENLDNKLFGPFISFMNHISGHMLMVVAVAN